jgi:hypothetical protein
LSSSSFGKDLVSANIPATMRPNIIWLTRL